MKLFSANHAITICLTMSASVSPNSPLKCSSKEACLSEKDTCIFFTMKTPIRIKLDSIKNLNIYQVSRSLHTTACVPKGTHAVFFKNVLSN